MRFRAARLIAVLAVVRCAAGASAEFPFEVRRDAEVVVDIDMRSPGSDWTKPGREAAVAKWSLDGDAAQGHIMVWSGEQPRRYAVFLGALHSGRHVLRIDRDPTHSAGGSELETRDARFLEYPEGSERYDVVANAPVLFARANTIGRFSDIPLFTYAEKLFENGTPLIQYTVVFSNEDGGTNTRALMARWGRTTDIEYVYRVYLDSAGRVARSIIQTRDHKDVEFTGARDGRHPLLIPVTDNNMVASGGSSALRYQLAPTLVDLTNASREQAMDDEPLAYRVMVGELEREGKLRPWGKIDGAKISDPRNYLYVEARIANQSSRLSTLVRLNKETRWRSSDTGMAGSAIERSGWVRTTVELPPSTKPSDVAEIGFQCLAAEKSAGGVCRVEQVRKAFFLNSDCTPQTSFWNLNDGRDFMTGEMVSWKLR